MDDYVDSMNKKYRKYLTLFALINCDLVLFRVASASFK